MVPGISGLSVSDFPGSIGICHADGYHHRGPCQRGSPLDDLYGITVPAFGIGKDGGYHCRLIHPVQKAGRIRESEIDYIVVRCSKGSITNLHLNNKAHWWNELSLSEEVRQQIYFQCQEAVQSLDLRYAGVDVLIERGTDIPYIIEVNGQGDHVYQDMFAHNSIYTQQIKNIKKKYNHANR